MKNYHVTIGWALTKKDSALWEETYEIPAKSKGEAILLAGFAHARQATSARVIAVRYVKAEKVKPSRDPVRVRAGKLKGDE